MPPAMKIALHTDCEKTGYRLCSDRGNVQMVSDGLEQVRLPIYRVREIKRKVRQGLHGLRGEHFRGAQPLSEMRACSEGSDGGNVARITGTDVQRVREGIEQDALAVRCGLVPIRLYSHPSTAEQTSGAFE